MNPPAFKPVIVPTEGELRAPRLRSVVWKSALLNAVIVLTSFPVLLSAGGPKAVAPLFAIMAGISVVIWAVTFTVFSFASLPWIFRSPVSKVAPLHPVGRAQLPGLADPWLDESP